jgi:hypothetical protein
MRPSSTTSRAAAGTARRAGSYGMPASWIVWQDRLGVLRLVLRQHRVHEAVAEERIVGRQRRAIERRGRLAADVVEVGEGARAIEDRAGRRASRARARRRRRGGRAGARRRRGGGAASAPGAPTAPRSSRCARGPS